MPAIANPFLSQDFEKHLEALTRGPMTSNQHGALIRPVDQLAEAVRSLHGKVAGLEEQLKYAKAPVDKGIPMHTYRVVCEQRDHELGERQIEVLRNRDLERALTTSPSAAVEGMRKALEAQPCRCSLLLKCPHCAGDVVEGVDQFSGSWICGACVETVALPKDPAYPCIRCAALAAWEEAIRG